MRVNRLSEKGFTLFEILVAVSIFAVISTMSMSSLIQVGRSGEQISESQRQLAELQFALSYLGKDIIQMVGRKVRDQYGDEQPQLSIAEDRLTFSRLGWSNLLQQKRSNLQRVEYRLVGKALHRRFWPQLDQAYTDVSIEQALLQDVEKFSVRLITEGKEKIESWPLDQQNSTATRPVALELTLELAGFGQIQRIYELSDAML